MNEELKSFFQRDRKLGIALFGIAFLVGIVGLLTFDFVLVSFAGLITQVGVVFFIGLDRFTEFFREPGQKIAGATMVLGLLMSLKGWYKLGGILEWLGFLYLFRAFRGLFKGIAGLFLRKKAPE